MKALYKFWKKGNIPLELFFFHFLDKKGKLMSVNFIQTFRARTKMSYFYFHIFANFI